MRSTNGGLGSALDVAVELGAHNDPASMWEAAQKAAREGISKHVDKLVIGNCKDYAQVQYSVGYIRAMNDILAVPSDRKPKPDSDSFGSY